MPQKKRQLGKIFIWTCTFYQGGLHNSMLFVLGFQKITQ